MGRLTADPLAHISWFGTVIFPALSILSGSPIFFGWANPVPVDMRNFKNPRGGMAIVAAAGPASNLVIAVLCTTVLSATIHSAGAQMAGEALESGQMLKPALQMLFMAIQLNLFLAFFNLLPLPPLDGSRIVQGFVSHQTAEKIDQFAPQAQMIILLLFISGAMRVLAVPVNMALMSLLNLFNVPLA